MEKLNERKSNIELLRIICMLMIMFGHYSIHGGFPEYGVDNFSLNVLFLQIISLFAKMACIIFMIISGYFLVNKNEMNLKKIIILILEMTFYNILIYSCLILLKYEKISIKGIIKSILPLFYSRNWFIIDYIIIAIISPFINKFIKALNKEELKKFIKVAFCLGMGIPFILIGSKWKFNDILVLIISYILGGYLRLYFDIQKEYNSLKIGEKMVAFFSGLCLTVIISDIIGLFINNSFFIENATYFSNINSPIVFALGMYVFILFLKMDFKNRIINTISTSCLGVYLIHDNEFFRKIIWEIISPNNHFFNSNSIIVHAFLKVSVVFVFCIFVDKIRLLIFERPIVSFIDMRIKNKKGC